VSWTSQNAEDKEKRAKTRGLVGPRMRGDVMCDTEEMPGRRRQRDDSLRSLMPVMMLVSRPLARCNEVRLSLDIAKECCVTVELCRRCGYSLQLLGAESWRCNLMGWLMRVVSGHRCAVTTRIIHGAHHTMV